MKEARFMMFNQIILWKRYSCNLFLFLFLVFVLNLFNSLKHFKTVVISSYHSGTQGHGGTSEESEEATSEVPAAVTVEVEEIHPLPEVKHVFFHLNTLNLHTRTLPLHFYERQHK